MSAYIVNDNHINVIVSFFIGQGPRDGLWCKLNNEYDYLNRENAAEAARILYAQNVRSVDTRYSEENAAYYTFKFLPFVRNEFALGEIAGALDCLEYQSCETEDYYKTEAYGLICLMRKDLLSKLQEVTDTETWDIDENHSVNYSRRFTNV